MYATFCLSFRTNMARSHSIERN